VSQRAIRVQSSDIKLRSIDGPLRGPINQPQGQSFPKRLGLRFGNCGTAILECHAKFVKVLRIEIILTAYPNDVVQATLLGVGPQQLVTRPDGYKQNLT
jgi:hypothetical protein